MLLLLLVCVDDIILAGNDQQSMSLFKLFLDNWLTLKDLGTLKSFQGMEVARTTKRISLCERKYALDVLKLRVTWVLNLFLFLLIKA